MEATDYSIKKQTKFAALHHMRSYSPAKLTLTEPPKVYAEYTAEMQISVQPMMAIKLQWKPKSSQSVRQKILNHSRLSAYDARDNGQCCKDDAKKRGMDLASHMHEALGTGGSAEQLKLQIYKILKDKEELEGHPCQMPIYCKYLSSLKRYKDETLSWA